eukprot:3647494-Prymnesium_polylepis.2
MDGGRGRGAACLRPDGEDLVQLGDNKDGLARIDPPQHLDLEIPVAVVIAQREVLEEQVAASVAVATPARAALAHAP